MKPIFITKLLNNQRGYERCYRKKRSYECHKPINFTVIYSSSEIQASNI